MATTPPQQPPQSAAMAPQEVSAHGLPFPLQENERVLQVCRRHWLYLWPRVLLMAIVGLLPPIIVGILLSEAGAYEGVAEKVFWVLAAAYIVYWAVRALLVWYRYRHDIWVVTNQRLIDSFRTNPFNLKISTADLVNVQDMTVERSGILRTVFDFGDVVCQTAADLQEFRISAVPHPRDVQALVDRERDRERLRYSRNV
jgi:hypothetical protein